MRDHWRGHRFRHAGFRLLPKGIIARPGAGNPDLLKHPCPRGACPKGFSGDDEMSKEKSRGHKEPKKPKKERPRVLATANSRLGIGEPASGGKKAK